MSQLKLMGKNHSDELYTPKEALDVLIPFLPKDKVLWECAVGTGRLRDLLIESGFQVHATDDFFNQVRGGHYRN